MYMYACVFTYIYILYIHIDLCTHAAGYIYAYHILYTQSHICVYLCLTIYICIPAYIIIMSHINTYIHYTYDAYMKYIYTRNAYTNNYVHES